MTKHRDPNSKTTFLMFTICASQISVAQSVNAYLKNAALRADYHNAVHYFQVVLRSNPDPSIQYNLAEAV